MPYNYVRKTRDVFDIEGFYAQGWEPVTAADTRKEARELLATYRENEPKIAFRIVKTRERIELPDAGTPAQEAILDAHDSEYPGYPKSHYQWACEVLEAAGLLEDNGYRYGTSWLTRELPAEIIEEVQSW